MKMRHAIWSRDGKQIGYKEGNETFDMKGRKRYDVDGVNLIDPRTRKIVGHLSVPDGDRTNAADHLFSANDDQS